MRIRKRPPGSSSAAQKQRLIQQLPATFKYVFPTDWLLKRAHQEHDKQQRAAQVDARCEQQQQQHGKKPGSRRERKPQQHNPSGDAPPREVIGEEPRTPPPFCGEKPALARHKSELQLDTEVKCLGEGERGQCSCGKDQPQAKKPRKKQVPDSVKGESSGAGRKGSATRGVEQQQQAASRHEHLLASARLQDTAESSERSSHDNCGPQQSSSAGGGASLGESYLRELSKMDPLRRAMHTVVSEAGIQGLTPREAAERISRRGLVADSDIPRSVKMAKAMRDSPYLLEMTRSSKFVLWSTFLEESSKRTGESGDSVAAGAGSGSATKRRRHSTPGSSSRNAGASSRNVGVEMVAGLESSRNVGAQQDDRGESTNFKSQVAAAAAAPPATQRRMFDLNLAPDDVEEDGA